MKTLAFLSGFLIALQLSTAEAQLPEHHWVNPLPAGAHERVHHSTYHSAVMGIDVGYAIYLPPGYEDPANSERRYPVVYFHHGGFEGNEGRMLNPARQDMASLIDAWIQSGDVGPMIYVFPNGGPVSNYDHERGMSETTFVRELIPHVDARYRTIAGRAGRGIEGFSAGARGAARDMFKYPELFCSAAPLSGGHQHEKIAAENEGRLAGITTGIVVAVGDNSWDLAEKYAARSSDTRVQILVAVGTDDMNYEANLEWMDHLESLDIPFKSLIIPDAPHDPVAFYEEVGDQIMSFHESCFQMAGD